MLETHTPLIADPKALLLEMGQCRQVSDVLRLIVARLAESPAVALARIWLIKPIGLETFESCSTSSNAP